MNSSALTLKRKIVIAIALVWIVAITWFVVTPHSAASQPSVVVNGRTIHLEIADTPEAELRGLGGRTSLDPDWGMLFLFKTEGLYPFWMKDMHFPIDIIWIDQGTVTEVVTLPPPVSRSDTPKKYTPTKPADRVLELNAGMAKKLGISPGSRLDLPR